MRDGLSGMAGKYKLRFLLTVERFTARQGVSGFWEKSKKQFYSGLVRYPALLIMMLSFHIYGMYASHTGQIPILIRGSKMMKRCTLIVIGIMLALPLWSQNQSRQESENADRTAMPASLPRTFQSISLGMDIDALKKKLAGNTLFYFRGDADVSFLPGREESLVETTGFSFIKRAFFQLRDGNIFIMAFSLDPSLIDHYSVFTTFIKKYGEPASIDPSQAVWESDETRIDIERPLTVKYIDKQVFGKLIGESGIRKSGGVLLREDFLNEF
jgi:hypothetical protein